MEDYKTVLGRMALTLTLVLFFGNSAHAYVFSLDNFAIDKDGSSFFQDGFNGTVAPPQGPNGPNTYGVVGTVGPEASGRLTLDRNDAASVSNARGEPTLLQAAVLRTNINGNNRPAGFYLGDAVSLTAIFDLIPPPEQRQSYGIRFTDRIPNLSLPGNDVVELRVFRDIANELLVSFIETDFVNNTISPISSALLDTAHDQIALMLDLNTTGLVNASFAYLDGGTQGAVTPLTGSSQIFQGEDWTRAQFLARQVVDVPEPATLALFGIGLAGLGFARKKKQSVYK